MTAVLVTGSAGHIGSVAPESVAHPPAVIAVYTVTAYRRTLGYLAVFAVHLIIAIGYYLVVPLTDAIGNSSGRQTRSGL